MINIFNRIKNNIDKINMLYNERTFYEPGSFTPPRNGSVTIEGCGNIDKRLDYKLNQVYTAVGVPGDDYACIGYYLMCNDGDAPVVIPAHYIYKSYPIILTCEKYFFTFKRIQDYSYYNYFYEGLILTEGYFDPSGRSVDSPMSSPGLIFQSTPYCSDLPSDMKIGDKFVYKVTESPLNNSYPGDCEIEILSTESRQGNNPAKISFKIVNILRQPSELPETKRYIKFKYDDFINLINPIKNEYDL